ncbi:hypothetical protein COT03_02450 [Candidatus Shapirobacteria bacterium CG07_land_8_20_14_0_80_39_18]|uniref:Uncharacterized protein n=1 Tax=Candidatus Shapirobacteria bacterium CG07_land_8_20_14_0_80_39_18 TaxID=1974882 RepID=A0A2M6YQY8_9BACT|nr:MAG: hypothetical protein COT03_02450 [Candidatus Shapirobacteria bacterium CG07_land_8_20_14_0_80_39_18]
MEINLWIFEGKTFLTLVRNGVSHSEITIGQFGILVRPAYIVLRSVVKYFSEAKNYFFKERVKIFSLYTSTAYPGNAAQREP